MKIKLAVNNQSEGLKKLIYKIKKYNLFLNPNSSATSHKSSNDFLEGRATSDSFHAV